MNDKYTTKQRGKSLLLTSYHGSHTGRRQHYPNNSFFLKKKSGTQDSGAGTAAATPSGTRAAARLIEADFII